MSGQLELGGYVVTAILATWLGVTVVTRARSNHASRVFGWVTLLLTAWSSAIVVERVVPEHSPAVAVFKSVEDAAAFLLPAATLHIVLAFTVEGRRAVFQRAVLWFAYLLGVTSTLQAVADPGHPIAVDAPHLVLGAIPGALLGWIFIALRVVIFALAIWWCLRAWRLAGADTARRGQTAAALATVVVAAVGGSLRLLPTAFGGPKWVGVSLVCVAMLLATYAVFAQGVFLTPRVARRASRTSLLTGLAVTAYAVLVIGLETLLHRSLGLELPIFTALVIAATIAGIEPLREAIVRTADARLSDREATYRRLVRLLEPGALTVQRPEVAVGPAIARVSRVLDLSGAVVANQDGSVIAEHGAVDSSSDATLAVPLAARGRSLGIVRFGARRSGSAFSSGERALLGEVAGYLAAALELGHEQQRQTTELDSLGSRHRAVVSRGQRLDRALSGTLAPAKPLRVEALGPLHVELGGEVLQRWGGPKAGTRQAEALFAFLFDRGERGASKDEIVEVIWPDADLVHADAAFHRTLVGLRGTLEPERAPREESVAVRYRNDRYHLDPAVVEWSDVWAFTALMDQASAATTDGATLDALEAARALYRGDYLDDCPFYGDSEYVEERRSLLRGQYVDLLVALGELYEARADRPAAASFFREALGTAGGELPNAEAGLARLGAVH